MTEGHFDKFGLILQSLGFLPVVGQCLLLLACLVYFAKTDKVGKHDSHWPVWAWVVPILACVSLYLCSDTIPPFDDLTNAYLPAGHAALNDSEQLRPMLLRGVRGFVNMPILAYLFAPFALLPEKAAVLLFFGIGIAMTGLAMHRIMNYFALDTGLRRIAIVLWLLSGPLMYSVKEGNTSHMILLPAILSLEWLRRGHDLRAGVCLGLCAILKLPLLLLGLTFVLLRRWRAVVGFGLAVVIPLAVSLLTYGFEVHREWYEASIAPYSARPLAAFNVHGITAWFARLSLPEDVLLNWNPQDVSPGVKRLGNIVAGAILVMFCWVVDRARRDAFKDDPHSATDLSLMLTMLVCMVVSPLTWNHYLSWILLPATVLLTAARKSRFVVFVTVCGALAMAPISYATLAQSSPNAAYALSMLPLPALVLWCGALVFLLLRGSDEKPLEAFSPR
jgi:alpha-1,2-mannosyltransferase